MPGGIVVFAYAGVGHACLDHLLAHGEPVAALFTHEDAPDERLWFASCAALARAHGVPVHTVEPDDGPEMHDIIAALRPALILSFYYRRMIPMAILRLAARGAFNMHGSLLPKYRGRAPVNWAVLHGESETGVTLHEMTARADAGDIVDQERIPIGLEETAGDVMARLAPAAVRLLARQIAALKVGTITRTPQDEARATRFGRRRPEDGRIDWSRSACEIVNLVRAVAPPYPGAFTEFDGRKLMIWRAGPIAGAGAPGEILTREPLVIAAGKDAVHLLRFGFPNEPEDRASAAVVDALRQGQTLG